MIAQPERRYALALAFRLGCTMDELGQRISSAEFTEWVVFMRREHLMPGEGHVQHAEMLSALFNGPVQKRGSKEPWKARDLLGPDPWAPPPPALTLAEQRQQRLALIKHLNAHRRR